MLKLEVKPKVTTVLDKDFMPISLINRAFRDSLKKLGKSVAVKIALEREGGLISSYSTEVFPENSGMDEENLLYIERIVKTLLWARGGWKLTIGGPESIGKYISGMYSQGGGREFDAKFMGRVYEKEFTVVIADLREVPGANEAAKAIGRHLKGCRIGLDLGGSRKKISAVIDGKVVFTDDVLWQPKAQSNPDYHYEEILNIIKTAAAHLPRLDGLGISSAGIIVNNRAMISSLFIKVPEDVFNAKVKGIFKNIDKALGGIPFEVANDGDVTALAGAMGMKASNVLGVSMGTSQAGGYVDGRGNITGWLNELAFVPIDYNPRAMVDEWSGDYGCGVKYLSQDAVVKLAPAAGIDFSSGLEPSEKLRLVQELLQKGDSRAIQIFEAIGCYLGYAVAHYQDFYDINYAFVLGGVTADEGGRIILEKASEVLAEDFPDLAYKINFTVPEDSFRKLGQSITAASLPEISM
ncbi:putative NBD/HSP70 family sugar kinase [Ruminiclostridium sufflavum DSM 19573]|uniref:Putative NBD/HSP70 family sugar kinase n=1 Tax=Ruminiclostridium sufflavum DSM 19573 TaxID=1121337 RepID=A0A318XNW7_9FIRM|nr:ROK family protein [Ruminiclostridium sufflavum]PYG88715.1 putative NBD/HSP70 family sugar kinase [Ruminiclostridium sufflavum DSM 19573]